MKTSILILFFSLISISSINSQWQEQFTNLPNLHLINCIDAVDENVCWATGYKLGFPAEYLGYIRTTDGGSNWICDTIETVTGVFTSLCAIDAGTAYVSIKQQGVSGKIYKTTDGGNQWQQQTVGFTVLNDAPKFIHFFDSAKGVAIGQRQGNYFEIFTTTDGGNNWLQVPNTNMPALLSNEVPAGDDYASALNSIWFLTSESRIFRSTDAGITWSYFNSPQNFSGGDPNISFQNGNTGILIANMNSLWKTNDSGQSWSPISYSGYISPRYICYVPGSSSTYVITSQGGSIYTPDGGNSFITIDSIGHFHLDFVSISTGWADGSSTGRIYKWAGSFVPVEEEFAEVSDFVLEQNYPNPFNPSTKIKYQIPASLNPSKGGTLVTLKVFDVLGNEIETLVSEEKQTGTYELTWNASNLPNGVYFYQLKAGSFVQTKKMILIK